ncbi:MAG TPA: GMC family oxidoreductase [Acidimicrobiales bacterium]|nr:GMC family oxidoreductase [Acidimicrobiales bacterium]
MASGEATAEVTPQQHEILRAVADRMIPADDWPSAGQAGVVEYLERHAGAELAAVWSATIAPGLAALDEEARRRTGRGYAELDPAEQDGLLAQAPAGLVSALAELVAEGYYTSPEDPSAPPPPAWAMIGFVPRHPGHQGPPLDEQDPPAIGLAEAADRYDAVVVGGGAGGGAAAASLAGAGLRVLLVERGRWLPWPEVGRDHLRNHRLSVYGHNTGPDDPGAPRTVLDAGGRERTTRPWEGDYHNNAMTYGGGTRVFGAQAWRFMPDDFAMASRYGIPDGSSLADWPFGYEELAPYYEQAEWAVGVSGDGQAHRAAGRRHRGYPMPPVPANRQVEVLGPAAAALGWDTGPVPLLVNSVPWGGRSACERCGQCVGFACPANAKNGPYNTVLPAALASGCCDLVLGAQALRVVADGAGRVTGVELAAAGDGSGPAVTRRITAGHVVLAAGAIESARLLLNSPTDREPAGMGNATDQVGRHLQGHTYCGAFGLWDDVVCDGLGPGVSIATLDLTHGHPDHIGGAMLANEFVRLPSAFWRQALPPDTPRWGPEAKAAMRDGYRRTIQVQGPTQEVPSPDARVRVSPRVKDRFGMPVAMLSGSRHPETLRTSALMSGLAAAWLQEAGARRVWRHDPSGGLSAGQHQAGTLRMGADPATSVTDPTGRVHGHDNLWVADGSLHVTNGCVNPVLTILALAHRTADHLARA